MGSGGSEEPLLLTTGLHVAVGVHKVHGCCNRLSMRSERFSDARLRLPSANGVQHDAVTDPNTKPGSLSRDKCCDRIGARHCRRFEDACATPNAPCLHNVAKIRSAHGSVSGKNKTERRDAVVHMPTPHVKTKTITLRQPNGDVGFQIHEHRTSVRYNNGVGFDEG